MTSLNSFSQAEATGDFDSWEELDEKEFGCSTEVCEDIHTPSELLKVMDNASLSQEIARESGSSPKNKVCEDIHKCSFHFSSGNRQCSCE